MIYSTTCSYAVRAMSRLAALRPDGYVRIQEICDDTDLPSHFVAKIFRDLVRDGLLISAKGRGGGFALGRAPQKIKLIDIVEAVDGIQQYNRCVSGLSVCDDDQPCSQHELFKPVRKQILAYLNSASLEDMANALKVKMDLIGKPLTLQNNGKPLPKR